MNVWDLMTDEEKLMVYENKADKADANASVLDTISFLKLRYAEAGKTLQEALEMQRRLLKANQKKN